MAGALAGSPFGRTAEGVPDRLALILTLRCVRQIGFAAAMRIAFYAPLKAPTHPVPSGDREMARLLMRALSLSGHEVELASDLRSYGAAPDPLLYAPIHEAARIEAARLAEAWRRSGPPDLWFSYHPYHKAPDLVGPGLAAAFAIPYVAAEASYSQRRAVGAWADNQRLVLAALTRSAAVLCLTERDRAGLASVVDPERLVLLRPFIDVAPFAAPPEPRPGEGTNATRIVSTGTGRLAIASQLRASRPNDSASRSSSEASGLIIISTGSPIR